MSDVSPRVAACVAELHASRTHGGSWMARRAVETLVEVAHEDVEDGETLLGRLVEAGRELADSRPEVGAVAGAVGRLLAAIHHQGHLPVPELRRLLELEAQGLVAQRDRAARSIAIQLRERLTNALVLTHSASATVREAILHTPPELVYCTISEPQGEGRAFAEELRAAGLRVELVDDDAAPSALEEASLLLLGADTIYRDGTLANKAGTRRLAEAAGDLDVLTVVAAEVIKLAPFEAAEVPEARGFDLTPPELIDEVVTEEGTYRSDELGPLFDRTPFLSAGYALLAQPA